MNVTHFISRLQDIGCTREASPKIFIRAVNIVCLVNITLALTIGSFLYLATGAHEIGLAAYIEVVLFSGVLWLNARHKYGIASILAHMVMNAAVLYFGLLFGRFVSVNLMAIFLVALPLLFFKDGWEQFFCFVISLVTISLVEVNRSENLVEPMNLDYGMIYFKWVANAVILFLTAIILYLFRKHHVRLYESLKILTNKLRYRTRQLFQANRAKTDYIQETMHEVRSPLNVISGISQLLNAMVKERDFEGIEGLSDDLRTACYQVVHTVNSTLDLSRLESGKLYENKKEPIIVREWINDIVRITRYLAQKKDVCIDLWINEDIPLCIEGDIEKLTRIVNNMLFNAIKMTADNTVVKVCIDRRDQFWSISITDEGPGMSTEQVSKAFEPFETSSSNASGGTGLGLHILDRLVSVLGGAIHVKNNTDKRGMTFTAEFKIRVLVSPVLKNPNKTQPSYHKLRFLIVEDDSVQRLYMGKVLEKRGATVLSAQSGEIALAKMAVLTEAFPHVILLDKNLPDMSGMDLAYQLRQFPQLEGATIIIVSGDAYMKKEISNVVNGYILKPLEISSLDQELRNLPIENLK